MKKKRWAEKVAIHCNFAVVICILKHLQLDEYILHWFRIWNTNAWIENVKWEKWKMFFLVPDIFVVVSFLKINHFIFAFRVRKVYLLNNGITVEFKTVSLIPILQKVITVRIKNDRRKLKRIKTKLNWFISLLSNLCTFVHASSLFAIFSSIPVFFPMNDHFQWDKFSNKLRINETFQPKLKHFTKFYKFTKV